MTDRLTLVDKLRILVTGFDDHHVPYLIGGALALAYHVAEPRTTQDIDIQVYPPSGLESLLNALPTAIDVTQADRDRLLRQQQARLRWSGTPIDIFLPADPFHHDMKVRAVEVPFPGLNRPLRIVSASDLTVLKALFDRPKDWVDIGEMLAYGSVDLDLSARWLRHFEADVAAARLLSLMRGL